MRRLGIALVLVLGSLALTACVPPGFACPAIGYSSVAHLTLADPRPGLSLELCDGAGCAPAPAMHDLEADGSTPFVDTGVMSLVGDSATGWTASLMGGQPQLGYRLTDAAGVVVAEGEVDAEWVRVGGSEQCGGPTEAHVVIDA